MSKTAMGLHGGALFELLPGLDEIDNTPITREGIAHSLGRTFRYGAQCPGLYSVAEHSVKVSQVLPPHLRLHGLMHDAHEAFVGDMISPVANALDCLLPGFKLHWNGLKHALDYRIYSALGLGTIPVDIVDRQLIHEADLAVGAAECLSFGWPVTPGREATAVRNWAPAYWSPDDATRWWLDELREAEAALGPIENYWQKYPVGVN